MHIWSVNGDIDGGAQFGRCVCRNCFNQNRKQRQSLHIGAWELSGLNFERGAFSSWHYPLRSKGRVLSRPLKRGLIRACCIYYSINDADIIWWLKTVTMDCWLLHVGRAALYGNWTDLQLLERALCQNIYNIPRISSKVKKCVWG
jgi:hypothetical protein